MLLIVILDVVSGLYRHSSLIGDELTVDSSNTDVSCADVEPEPEILTLPLAVSRFH